jgi:tRNA(fMet)-specific endonuclease VapC
MLVLDTDLLTIVQRHEGEHFGRLQERLEIAASSESVGVTIISFEEQTRGWLTYSGRVKTSEMQVEAYARLHAMQQDFCDCKILDFELGAAGRFEELRKAKIRIGAMDLKIAAIVLIRGAKLLSRKLGDFRKVPGLPVEDWTLP